MNLYTVAITTSKHEGGSIKSKNHVDIIEAEGAAQAMGILVNKTWTDGWHLSSYSTKEVSDMVQLRSKEEPREAQWINAKDELPTNREYKEILHVDSKLTPIIAYYSIDEKIWKDSSYGKETEVSLWRDIRWGYPDWTQISKK